MLHSRPKVTTHLKPHEPEGFPLKTKTASLSDLLREAVLKGQCNMKNNLIVREVRGAMTQLEPLTAELFDYRLLRTEYGRKLLLVAGCLLNEDLLKALQTGLDGK